MKFLVIKHSETKVLAAILVQDFVGKIWYIAYNKWYEDVLGGYLGRGRFFHEERLDNRTIVKKEIPKDDPKFFDVLKTRIPAPYIVYVSGEVAATTAQEALEKLWKVFSPKPPRQVVGV